MARKVVLVWLALLIGLTAYGQDYELAAVNGESDIVDGDTYFITAHPSKSSKRYENLKVQQSTYADTTLFLLRATNDKKLFADAISACAASDLFEIRLTGGERHLYSKRLQRYIGTDIKGSRSVACATDDAEANSKVTFETANGLLYLQCNNRYLHYQTSDRTYVFRNKIESNSNNYLPILLYRLSYPATDALVFDDESGLNAAVSTTTDVIYRRRFHDNCYNTQCLPFDIADYKAVFGRDVTAYEPTESTDSSITFSPVAGNGLARGKPYLLYGTFGGKEEFRFSHVKIDHDGSATLKTMFNGRIFTTAWQRQTLSHDRQAFLLYKDKFVNGGNQSHVTILPFRWFISLPQSAAKPIGLRIRRR